MKKISKRTALVAVATAGATIAAGSLAYAFWTTNGTGNATAKASSFVAPGVAIDTAAVPTKALWPGGTSDLLVQATNTNPFTVTVVLAQDNSAGKLITSGNSGCNETTPGSAAVTGVSFSGGTITIPGNTTTPVSRTIANAVSMATTSSSANSCIGAVFSIPVTSVSTSTASST